MSSENCRLEGWLIKKRGDYHKNKFFHHDNMRWFKLQEVKGNDHSELALCYFKSQRDKEPRGWIYVKDVSEIVDTETSFTVVSPARTMTIEATTPVELLNWLRAMVESCPHADTSRVTSSSVRYGSHRSNPHSNSSNYNDGSKEDDIDYDEYRPLDKDSLMRLDRSARDKNDGIQVNNKALGDRSISLFSRNADGDKNSFYFASSGQTQTLATNNENNKSGTFSSDDDLTFPQHRIVEEGEVMDELGGLQKNLSRDNLRSTSGGGQGGGGRGVADSRDREDHRMRGGGGYGGNSSTSNRLHSHIARDTPPRAGQLNNPAVTNSRHQRTHSGQQGSVGGGGGGESEEERERDRERGRFGNESPSRASIGGTVGSGEEGGAFDSTSSLYVHRDSPHAVTGPSSGAGAGTARNFPFPGSASGSPTRPGGNHDAHLEVTTLSAQQEHDRIAHSRARLREKHRKNQQQQRGRVSGPSAAFGASGSGSDSQSGSDSASESSDSSAGDYEKGSRVAATRRRVASREGPGPDGGPGMHSGNSSPAHRVFQSSNNNNNGGGGGASSHNNSAGNMRVPAPLGAPPRRAKDAMLLEAANETADKTSGVRMSIDDVLKRRPSQQEDAADAKETSPRSGGGRSLVNGDRGDGNNSDDDADFDFKSERRNRREGDSGGGSDAKESTSTQSGGSAASSGPCGSRPPRPPGGMKPPSNANIYSASAAAVIAGKSVPVSGNSGVGSGVGSGGGGGGGGGSAGGGGGNFTFSQSSINHGHGNNNLGQAMGMSNINTAGGAGSGGAFNPRRGTSTPPRQAGDPGAKVDSNFVEEDWDAEDDHVTLSHPNNKNTHHNNNNSNHNNNTSTNNTNRHKAEAKHDDHHTNHNTNSNRDVKDTDFDNEDLRSRNYPSTVRADPNWLDENFDDGE